MRGARRDVMAIAGAGGALSALQGIQITVYSMNADGSEGAQANIYQAQTGGATGPSPSTDATGTNPFTTGASGAVEFWTDPGMYIMNIHDTQVPARIADRQIGFSSLALPIESAQMGSDIWPPVPADSSVTWAKLNAALIGAGANQVPAGNDSRLADGAAALGDYRVITEKNFLLPYVGAAGLASGEYQLATSTAYLRRFTADSIVDQGTVFFLDPGDFPNLNGKTLKSRIVLEVAEQGVPSNIAFTLNLYRVNLGGAGGSNNPPVLVKIGSNPLVASVTSSAINVGSGHGRYPSGDFNFPSPSDMYALALSVPSNLPQNSQPNIRALVQARAV